MRTLRSTVVVLLVLCPLLALLGADAPRSQSPPGSASPGHNCGGYDRVLEPGWRFCPWCGHQVQTEVGERSIPDRDPWQTVLAFFEAYSGAEENPEAARQVMGEVLDLESILGEWVTGSLDRWEGLPPKLRGLMRRQAAPEMARAMTPIVLDILTSKQMLEAYPPLAGISYGLLRQSYWLDEDEHGDRAWLNASSVVRRTDFADFAAHRIHLRRKEGRWVITRIPFFGR